MALKGILAPNSLQPNLTYCMTLDVSSNDLDLDKLNLLNLDIHKTKTCDRNDNSIVFKDIKDVIISVIHNTSLINSEMSMMYIHFSTDLTAKTFE